MLSSVNIPSVNDTSVCLLISERTLKMYYILPYYFPVRCIFTMETIFTLDEVV